MEIRSQGVDISDKHIEMITSCMISKIRIIENESTFKIKRKCLYW